jgi:putative N-acetyltransferase (TIGR04045 family)
VVGAVRLYPLDPQGIIWQGDRLAVTPEFRVYQLGSDLVRLAVSTAAGHGGHVMKAHIQVPNVRFFQRLGWTIDGPEETYHGRPHQPMAIDLRGERPT